MSTPSPQIQAAASTVTHFVGGQLQPPSERSQPVFNPATGEVSRQVSLASVAEVEHAVATAKAAAAQWRQTPAIARARVMFNFKNLLEQHAEEFAALISSEHGKVLPDAMGEFQRGLENVEYACSAPELLKGEHSKNVSTGVDSWSEFQPLGVVAGITPFNFPMMVPCWMFPMALVCGNTFVLKPSERDPSPAMLMAELLAEAGLPDGVFNVVNGDKEAVDALLANPDVKGISFVGSTPIAEYIYSTGTANGKRVQALGGAKNHAIVMPDADLDNTVSALMGAAYGSCGERCMAISVAVAVGDEVADELVGRLSNEVKDLKIGPGSDPAMDMGPLITQAHHAKVSDYITKGLEEGAALVVDGRDHAVTQAHSGYFMAVRCLTTSGPAWRSTKRRSSVRCCVLCERKICKKPWT